MLQPDSDFSAYVPGKAGYEPFFHPLRLFHLEPPCGNVL
jgi:hypothetical protein